MSVGCNWKSAATEEDCITRHGHWESGGHSYMAADDARRNQGSQLELAVARIKPLQVTGLMYWWGQQLGSDVAGRCRVQEGSRERWMSQ